MTTHCSHCRAPLPAPRSRLLAGALLGLAYTVTFAFIGIFACLGPFGFMFLPLLLPGGITMISLAHQYASRERECVVCGVLASEPEPVAIAGGIGPQPDPGWLAS